MRGLANRPSVQLGLRENLPQFMLLVVVNALVGGMIGQERAVLPLLAEDGFGRRARRRLLNRDCHRSGRRADRRQRVRRRSADARNPPSRRMKTHAVHKYPGGYTVVDG